MALGRPAKTPALYKVRLSPKVRIRKVRPRRHHGALVSIGDASGAVGGRVTTCGGAGVEPRIA